MTLRNISAAALMAALLSTPAAGAARVCQKEPGQIAGPFVPDAATARAIFLAVETGRGPGADKGRFPVVKAQDEGDHWSVFRTQRPPEGSAQRIFQRVDGGGQLELRVDKCTGAISHASYAQ